MEGTMGKRILFTVLSTIVLTTAVVVSMQANNRKVLRARLTGFQEVPSISTTGTGNFEIRIDRHEASADYTLSYSGLESNAFMAHIHLGQRGVNGGIMTFLCGGGGKPPCPASPGTITGTIVAADIGDLSGQGISPGEFGEFLRALRSGNTYANVHTMTFPGGEIRGQIRTDSETNPH
jgi:hypothetical protein